MDTELKPFPKSEHKVITATFKDGEVIFLASPEHDIFLELGTVVTKRASHVEPASRDARCLFHILRFVFGDRGRVSNWTRTWRVLWRVNTAPVGGPILSVGDINPKVPKHCDHGKDVAVWLDRQAAIDAEVAFLDKWFLERA